VTQDIHIHCHKRHASSVKMFISTGSYRGKQLRQLCCNEVRDRKPSIPKGHFWCFNEIAP